MTVSIFDLFSIGIGPSSSHTVGPMRAANAFIQHLDSAGLLSNITRIEIHLYGSLALTGKGHATDKAVLMGLEGHAPETIDPTLIESRLYKIITQKQLNLAGNQFIQFDINNELLFHKDQFLTEHANGLTFIAFDNTQSKALEKTYFSIGGGFVTEQAAMNQASTPDSDNQENIPYPFDSAAELITQCTKHNKNIAELMLANEQALSGENLNTVCQKILQIWQVMDESISAGTQHTGVLPGGLQVKRRAPELAEKLIAQQQAQDPQYDPMSWLAQYSIAVNEENAAIGRVVTAPTNGAAGTIPAVIKYYLNFTPQASEQGIIDFLLTAAAVGILYKKGASISAAEVGCQGEVGVACSMAAAGLAQALGASVAQIENAAEIGMEHHLGLTCDPIDGLVQIPCIERNVMGATQAVTAAKLAMLGDGKHHVPLDKVIRTMLQTGKDMKSTYKETAQGGLAVNLPEC